MQPINASANSNPLIDVRREHSPRWSTSTRGGRESPPTPTVPTSAALIAGRSTPSGATCTSTRTAPRLSRRARDRMNTPLAAPIPGSTQIHSVTYITATATIMPIDPRFGHDLEIRAAHAQAHSIRFNVRPRLRRREVRRRAPRGPGRLGNGSFRRGSRRPRRPPRTAARGAA